jgi:hypothetical protein
MYSMVLTVRQPEASSRRAALNGRSPSGFRFPRSDTHPPHLQHRKSLNMAYRTQELLLFTQLHCKPAVSKTGCSTNSIGC